MESSTSAAVQRTRWDAAPSVANRRGVPGSARRVGMARSGNRPGVAPLRMVVRARRVESRLDGTGGRCQGLRGRGCIQLSRNVRRRSRRSVLVRSRVRSRRESDATSRRCGDGGTRRACRFGGKLRPGTAPRVATATTDAAATTARRRTAIASGCTRPDGAGNDFGSAAPSMVAVIGSPVSTA